jgi:subtilisin family serine protease
MAHSPGIFRKLLLLAAVGVLAACSPNVPASSNVGTTTTAPQRSPLSWMSSDVQAAWNSGYKGKGVTLIVVDNYAGNTTAASLDGTLKTQTHGAWTAEQAQMIAPEASLTKVDYNLDRATGYTLANGLNVINNSYGYNGSPSAGFFNLPAMERDTVLHAITGTAVVVVAAGNDSAVAGSLVSGSKDVLVNQLIGTTSGIVVGALDTNGSTTAKAGLASYSNRPGSSAAAQSNFLVVGVDSSVTGLYGTSFAAPIVSGYAAILGSKFTSATPTQITRQLLNTARTDTIRGYAPSFHGKGEASLSRALAPSALQ